MFAGDVRVLLRLPFELSPYLGDLLRDFEFIVTQRVAEVTCCSGAARGLSKRLSDKELDVARKMRCSMEW